MTRRTQRRRERTHTRHLTTIAPARPAATDTPRSCSTLPPHRRVAGCGCRRASVRLLSVLTGLGEGSSRVGCWAPIVDVRSGPVALAFGGGRAGGRAAARRCAPATDPHRLAKPHQPQPATRRAERPEVSGDDPGRSARPGGVRPEPSYSVRVRRVGVVSVCAATAVTVYEVPGMISRSVPGG